MRIAVAEDQVLLRKGLVRILEGAGHEVVAESDTAEDLLRKVAAHKPDLVVTDVRMPPEDVGGLRAAAEIRQRTPKQPVLVLTQFVEEKYAVDLLADDPAGIGYVLKDRISDIGRFLASVQKVADGGTVIDPSVVSTLMGTRRVKAHPIEELSEREIAVLELMAQGYSNAGIAEKLVVTVGAVEKHINSIFRKLDLDTDAEHHRRVLVVLEYLSRLK